MYRHCIFCSGDLGRNEVAQAEEIAAVADVLAADPLESLSRRRER